MICSRKSWTKSNKVVGNERRGRRSSGFCERRGRRSSGFCERRGRRSSGKRMR